MRCVPRRHRRDSLLPSYEETKGSLARRGWGGRASGASRARGARGSNDGMAEVVGWAGNRLSLPFPEDRLRGEV
jgi:hypothetical protein